MDPKCGVGLADESSHGIGVFDAGLRFDAAGRVDGVGANGLDGSLDVVGCQTAGENQRRIPEQIAPIAELFPVDRLAGSSIGVLAKGVDEND